jgi:hypothetical protein
MSTNKNTWKAFERDIARTDWDSERNPLSGSNSRQDDGSPRGGDVIIPQGTDVLVEAKYRASFLHHGLFEAAEADAKKHKKAQAILYTKQKRSHGWLVVLDGILFSQIVRIPQVQELLAKKDTPNEGNINK